jgi:hypothetical protein
VFDLNQRLWDEYDGSIDWESIDGLLEEFLDAPEGEPYRQEGTHWTPLVLEYALQYEVAAISEITSREMRTVLFELFPEKVSMDPDCAPDVIRE